MWRTSSLDNSYCRGCYGPLPLITISVAVVAEDATDHWKFFSLTSAMGLLRTVSVTDTMVLLIHSWIFRLNNIPHRSLLASHILRTSCLDNSVANLKHIKKTINLIVAIDLLITASMTYSMDVMRTVSLTDAMYLSIKSCTYLIQQHYS